MAEGGGDPADSPLARGLFGVFQAGAQARVGTAQIWSDLRTAAAAWQFQAQGKAQPYDPAELESAGRQILSAQGVGLQTVNTFRALSGSWLSAKQRLAGVDTTAQITAREIFRPPWATTVGESVPSRYRIRSRWQVTTTTGESFNVWKTDELTGALTSKGDALAQALPPKTGSPAVLTSMGDDPPVMIDSSIEQV